MKFIAALLLAIITTAPALAENINPKIYSFKTMSPPLGTSPVASTAADTLNFTSADNSCVITGTSGSKTLDWSCAGSGGGAAWGEITGTLSNQTDLQSALNLKAPLANPSFTGTITTPLTASRVLTTNGSSQLAASNVTTTTLAFLDATSSIQTQINGKQATGNYITALTGDVTASGPGSVAASISASTVTGKLLTGFSASAGTVAATDSILAVFNKLQGTMVQKAPLASPAFTGTIGTPLTASQWVKTDGSGNLTTSALVEEVDGQIETVSNKSYFVIPNAAYARTINSIYAACSTSGTVTLAVAIGGTPVTSCSSISVSATPATTTCTAANSITVNSIVSITASSNSSCLDLIFTVKTTR